MKDYRNDVERVLFSEEEIAQAIKRISRQIEQHYENSQKTLLLVGVLRGSAVFMADLMKEIKIPLEVDFVRLSSYGKSAVSSGNITIKAGLETKDLENYDVLVIEDIVDTGNTLSWFVSYLKEAGAGDVSVCTLLDKKERREKQVDVRFCGFSIPDEFVIGYGLDYSERYRNMSYIGILKREVYEH